MRFDTDYGRGTVVCIGNKRFPMPYETEDKAEIKLLRRAHGVKVLPAPKPFAPKALSVKPEPEVKKED